MEFSIGSTVAVLERTPVVLQAMLGGLPDVWVQGNEGPETFSPFDVVAHLVHGERDVWIPRARIILEQRDDRTFPVFDRVSYIRECAGRPLAELLVEFDAARSESLATLHGWSPGERELRLEGIHPSFGAVTLAQLLATWAAHDLSHIAQVSRVMAKQYRDAVGPWREFLSILDDRRPR